MDVGENAIEAWIREFSRSRFVPASVISSTVYERCRDLKGSDQRALTTAARKSCAAHLEARHWMRARVALLVRLSCSPDALARAERDGVLCAKNPLRESRQALLSLLERDSPADLVTIHPDLHARISTYAALESLCARYRRRYIDYRRALRTRPPGLIKAMLALADLEFLRDVLQEHPLEALMADLEDPPGAISTAEDVCSMVSLLVAEAAEEQPISALELSFPISTGFSRALFERFLPVASIRFRIHECTKYITALGYHLHHQRLRKDVYKMVEPKEGMERYFRIAHITSYSNKAGRSPGSGSARTGRPPRLHAR